VEPAAHARADLLVNPMALDSEMLKLIAQLSFPVHPIPSGQNVVLTCSYGYMPPSEPSHMSPVPLLPPGHPRVSVDMQVYIYWPDKCPLLFSTVLCLDEKGATPSCPLEITLGGCC
jgi:hypothetical protein